AIVCGFAGMCYAEMASTVPISGSAYTYAYATMGELIAWIIGWDLLLEYALGAATVSIGWSGYVVSFLKDFGIVVPDIWSMAPFDYDPAAGAWHRTDAIINIPAMVVTAAAAALLVIGIPNPRASTTSSSQSSLPSSACSSSPAYGSWTR